MAWRTWDVGSLGGQSCLGQARMDTPEAFSSSRMAWGVGPTQVSASTEGTQTAHATLGEDGVADGP